MSLDQLEERAYRWYQSGVNRTLLIFGLAVILGIVSLCTFFLTDDGVSRFEILLVLVSTGLIIYGSIESGFQ
ncbi:hypothetical protein AUR64_09950 [Haloprofundus marisrubri]|uniref:Transporter n=1 Tax=Haloprofundus marisrubri TaxID=1514971 RepID=A0A0W1R9H1_9EURY|nr:hypothetical protein [Haloprofundus marisrubri]KTG09935.1 hypothetical protein AUR64_09950 [Haloprofundus marisrubri]